MTVRRRVVVIVLLAWLPLLVLAVAEGHLLGGSDAVPFLVDVEGHIRLLGTALTDFNTELATPAVLEFVA